ncbi:hypothetical protein ACN42_g4264 [Penicillium freii]|uniref:Uncharacterized protein n=1 Tax=Penicillium freii TaxID=48697 RepID=A0A101MLP8_PENFR|nr:hypothetical protein ACN42_g4264 [Penicillium freii]
MCCTNPKAQSLDIKEMSFQKHGMRHVIVILDILMCTAAYLGSYTYLISSAEWGFPILATAAFMRALRVRLTE